MTQRVIACSFVLSSLVLSTLSFPTWITDFTCDKKLEVNEIVVGGKVIESDERHIRLWRGSNEIFSGDSYSPLEYLRLRLSKSGKTNLFEAKGGAIFVNGTCHGTRIASAHEVLLFLPDHDNDIDDVIITAERIVKDKLDSLSSNAEASALFLSEVRDRLTSQREVEDDIHLSNPKSGGTPAPQHETPSSSTGSIPGKKAKRPANHRRARPVGRIVDLEAAGPSSGEHADARRSKRIMLSKAERAREMQKIRDSGLFGVHGQGQGSHIEGKYRDKGYQGSSSIFYEVGGALTLMCTKLQREQPLLFFCGQILLCIFCLYILSRLYTSRYRIYRYFGKKRGLL